MLPLRLSCILIGGQSLTPPSLCYYSIEYYVSTHDCTSSCATMSLCDLHWTTVKNILKYIRNTKDMFLVYKGDIKRELKVSCYTDAGYLTDADDLKSQTGYVFVLNGGTVNWKSTKQSIFATSSAEAEYISAYDASKEAVWVRKFIFGLGVVPTIEEPINIVIILEELL
ncbi:hypothetical protein Tco_1016860 [Tanacetum coccineum]|uniref:Retrotransposon protein n=1 Tax=Tanacetum coccineum TaxID=301880 RepID=A0ABQ5FQ19_9ASTR